jgi:hypothetical protein
MVVVAITALLINHFRPVSRSEARRIAIAFTETGQPAYKKKLETLKANVHWIGSNRWYLVTWTNPNNDEDLDLPYDVLVNQDGRCSVFLGHAVFHEDDGIEVLDSYDATGVDPFASD